MIRIKGFIESASEPQRGTSPRGDWSKIEFVIRYDERTVDDKTYADRMCIAVFNRPQVQDIVQRCAGKNIEVEVAIDSRVREYNGRWYNDLTAYTVTPQQSDTPVAVTAPPMPQPAVPAPPQPQPSQDDLPF